MTAIHEQLHPSNGEIHQIFSNFQLLWHQKHIRAFSKGAQSSISCLDGYNNTCTSQHPEQSQAAEEEDSHAWAGVLGSNPQLRGTKGSAASTTMWPSSLNHGSRERRRLGSKQDQAGATGIHSKTPMHAPPPKKQNNNKKQPRGFHYSSRDKQGTYHLATTRLHSTPDEQATTLCSHRLVTKAEATRGNRQPTRTITPEDQK